MKQEAIHTIKQLIQENKLQDAIEALNAIESAGESNAEFQFLYGTLLHRQDKITEAAEAFKRSLLLNPNFTDSAISLSVIYNDTGNYQAAQKMYEQAVQSLQVNGNKSTNSVLLDIEISQKHFELGNLYLRIQRFDAAANEFLKTFRINPEHKEARIALAKTFAQRGQSDQAKQELLRLISEFPDYTQARVELALLYYSLGNSVEAQMELEEAHHLDPSNDRVKKFLSYAKNSSETTV